MGYMSVCTIFQKQIIVTIQFAFSDEHALYTISVQVQANHCDFRSPRITDSGFFIFFVDFSFIFSPFQITCCFDFLDIFLLCI
jgi:hypothetical protein